MTDYVSAPTDFVEAENLVQALCQNAARLGRPLSQSIRHWDGRGAGLFARAAKDCYQYQSGHSLGIMLRSMANTAIIIEHREASRR